MTNILDAWITCKFCHHIWFSNLNYAHKKFRKICLCIDFRNLNYSRNKNDYPVPSSKPILHAVLEAVVLSSHKGLFECHQVLVAKPGGLELVHKKLGPRTYHLQSLDERIDNLPVNGQDLKHYFQ